MSTSDSVAERYCVRFDWSPQWHIPKSFPHQLGSALCGEGAKSGQEFSWLYRQPTCPKCIAALGDKERILESNT